jgi:predicted nucleotidyltransferase
MNPIEKIISILTDVFPTLNAIYLFGSRNEKTAKKDSDWDIALLMPYGDLINSNLLWDTKWNLGGELGNAVDLIDLHAVPILFKAEIISTAKRIYTNDSFFCDLYETTTYSMYTKYCEEINANVIDIRNRGFVKYKLE